MSNINTNCEFKLANLLSKSFTQSKLQKLWAERKTTRKTKVLVIAIAIETSVFLSFWSPLSGWIFFGSEKFSYHGKTRTGWIHFQVSFGRDPSVFTGFVSLKKRPSARQGTPNLGKSISKSGDRKKGEAQRVSIRGMPSYSKLCLTLLQCKWSNLKEFS